LDAAVDAGSDQFELNEDQRAIREMAEAFATERIAPNALDWDRNRHFPADVIRETGPLGFGGIYVRDDVGGSGLARLDAVLVFEALSRACPGFAAFISIHNMASWMIDRFGNDDQRRKLWIDSNSDHSATHRHNKRITQPPSCSRIPIERIHVSRNGNQS
jgi:hypothetical protein